MSLRQTHSKLYIEPDTITTKDTEQISTTRVENILSKQGYEMSDL